MSIDGALMEPLKRGDTFLHRKWLAEDYRSPLRCVVTKVQRGAVYWRPADGGGCHVFDVEQTERYAMPVTPDAG